MLCFFNGIKRKVNKTQKKEKQNSASPLLIENIEFISDTATV